jgi:hypothetical protein
MARAFVTASSKYLSTSAVIKAYPVTSSCWFNPTTIADMDIFAAGNEQVGGNGYNYLQLKGADGKVTVQNFDGVNFPAAKCPTVLSTGTWYHVCGMSSYSGGNVTESVFINGANKTSNTATLTNNFSGSTKTSIGVFNGSSLSGYNNGTIADCAIWNVILTDAEVLALANGARPSTIRPLSLVGWWPLDGLQSPEPDLSGFVNNMTLTNSPAAAAGPPLMMFTPRWPAFNPFTLPSGVVVPWPFMRGLRVH